MKKYEIEKKLWEEAPKIIPKEWDKLDDESREKVIKEIASKMYEDVAEFENVLTNIRDRNENINFFIYGIVVGISGGLISDAISKLFDRVEVYGIYIQLIFGMSLFFYLLWNFGKYLKQKNDSAFKTSKVAVLLSEYAKKKIMDIHNNKNHKL